MTLSTVIMPCDNNELMSKGPNWPTIRKFGLIDIDVSSPHPPPRPGPGAQLNAAAV